MERWPPDYYEAILIHRGPLTNHEVKLLEKFEQTSYSSKSVSNLWIRKLDLESYNIKEVKELLKQKIPTNLPALAVWYPKERGFAPPLWVGKFNSSSILSLIESPIRRDISQRLIGGDAGVWLFVESGNSDKDNKAFRLLKGELDRAISELKKMTLTPMDMYWGDDLSFESSILRISRYDAKESFLLKMLLNSEMDLNNYSDEPIIFPMFGRGRILYSLVGEGINQYYIQETIAFLTGPCGCQFKALNPGVDLLITANWDSASTGSYGWDTIIPEVTGVLPESSLAMNKFDTSRILPQRQNHNNWGIMKTTAAMMGLILFVAIFGSVILIHLARR
jgi:hypothetical protein